MNAILKYVRKVEEAVRGERDTIRVNEKLKLSLSSIVSPLIMRVDS